MAELPTQVNFRRKGDKFCTGHPNEELQLICIDCNEQLVCIHCISTTHNGHTFVAISLFVKEKFKYLQDLTTETKKSKIPTLLKTVEDADTTVKELKQEIQIHMKKSEDHGEFLKELIDKSKAETVNDLKELENKITKQFATFKSDTYNRIKQLEELMKESREVTKTDDNVLILDVVKELSSKLKQDLEFKYCFISSMVFIKGSNPELSIEDAFGGLSKEYRPHPGISSTGRGENISCPTTHAHMELPKARSQVRTCCSSCVKIFLILLYVLVLCLFIRVTDEKKNKLCRNYTYRSQNVFFCDIFNDINWPLFYAFMTICLGLIAALGIGEALDW